MVIRFCFLLFILLGCYPTYAQHFLKNLPNEKPVQILSDDNGRFYLDYSNTVVAYSYKSDKVEYTVYPEDPDSQYNSHTFENVVTKKGVIYSLIESSIPHDDIIYNQYTLATFVDGKCVNKTLASWSIETTPKKVNVYNRSKLYLSRDDMLFFTLTKTRSGKDFHSKTYYYINGEETDGLRYSRLFSEHFPRPSSGVTISGKVPFSTYGREKNMVDRWLSDHIPKIALKKKYPFISFQKSDIKVSFNKSIVWDNKEYPHIFLHKSEDRSFYHRFYSIEDKRFIDLKIDGTESGQENTAFLSGNKIWTIHYFYRDPFNKGLLVSVHDTDSGKILKKFILDASKKRNSGWDLVGGKSSSGKVLLTYLSNSNKKIREYILLDKVEDLEVLGNNFRLYGTPKGSGSLKNNEVFSSKEYNLNQHNKEYRNYKLNLETGLQYVFFEYDTPPSESSDETHYNPVFEFPELLLNTYKISAQYGKLNLSFQSGVRLNEEDFDGDGDFKDFSNNNWKASIGIESFISDCSVKLGIEKMNSEVYFKDNANLVSPRYFDFDFKELKLTFTAFKRINFGIAYQKYNFIQPVYVYFSQYGLDYYDYDFQAIGDIDVKNYLIFIGFSTFNYIEKYETEYNDWFLNVEGYWGQTRGKLKNIFHTTGTTNMEKEDDIFVFGADLEFGWIWHKKFELLNQLGIQFKISYQIHFTKTGNSDEPGSDEDVLFEDDYYYAYERSEFRHGPLFSLSINF